MKNNLNTLLLVTGSSFTQATLSKQLKSVLPEHILIAPCLMDDEHHNLIGKYYTVFSSEETFKDFSALNLMDHVSEYIIGTRTVINDNLDKILTLPRNVDILLATDSMESALENVKHLQNVGFDFLNLVPFYPGCETDISHISIAVTPGDADMIPPGIETVYNVGARQFDFTTMVRIMSHYGILDNNLKNYADEYKMSLMSFAKRLSNTAYEAAQVMDTVRTQLSSDGYYAKHHFKDIIGETSGIKQAKSIGEKLAKTDLSVLLEGENGTGKELFASAIHNASNRRGKPFVAINFSALPDQLVESELFGYEDGAFTGAKKGGKIGLLQQADGGTIFMDEIGDISPKIQAKLLRVLEEKEIMKVGGNRIIPIDVRVIAATNCNLLDMIGKKTFRQDLYYRLREGYIYLPTLYDRKEDIPLLVEHLKKKLFKINKSIDSEVMEALMSHTWPGNIRELVNTLKFGYAVSEGDSITLSDIPYAATYRRNDTPDTYQQTSQLESLSMLVLKAINEINSRGEVAGRSKINTVLQSSGYSISEYRIRKILSKLADKNLIVSENGKYGLSLTEEGLAIVNK